MKVFWLSFLFFCCAVVTYVMLDSDDPLIVQSQDIDGYSPDYVATNLFSRNFDENGNLASTVFARTMESYPDLELVIFYQPEVMLFDDGTHGASDWRVEASEGSLFQNKEQLQLRGGVTITSRNPESQIQQISTPSLVLEIKENQMHTDDRVTAHGPQLEMSGVGLHANLNQQIVEILQQVEAQYEHHPAN